MKNAENENKRKLLMSYQENKRNVIRLEEQLVELQHTIMGSSRNHNWETYDAGKFMISDYAAKMDEIEQKLMEARYRRICAFQDVQQKIEAIEDEREKDVLTFRYLRGLKWEDVAVAMGYSWKHIHRLHNKALEDFKMT